MKIFEHETSDQGLVDILAYCLMPNHFHIVLRQKKDGGIERFMRKLATAYSMYFNAKYEHGGVLFQGRYKSSLIDNESYFRYIFAYVHLNPIDLIEPNWETSGIQEPRKVKDFMQTYMYSSYMDYSVAPRPASIILSKTDISDFLREAKDLDDLLKWHSSRTVLDMRTPV